MQKEKRMRKKFASIWLIGLTVALCLLGSCQDSGVISSPTPPAQTLPAPSMVETPPIESPPGDGGEQQAYQAFAAWNAAEGIDSRTATGFLPVEDGYAGLTGVVLYTDADHNTECNLCYLYEDGTCSTIEVVSNHTEGTRDFVLEQGVEYLGEGRVCLTAREQATGALYQYTVQCGPDGPGTDFSIQTDLLPD